MKLISINAIMDARRASQAMSDLMAEVSKRAYHLPFRFNELKGDYYAQVRLVVVHNIVLADYLDTLVELAANKQFSDCVVIGETYETDRIEFVASGSEPTFEFERAASDADLVELCLPVKATTT